ncbi:MAG: KH domain-containing protein [Thermoleophilia bacterium]|nr:KH domain-containing protein [Thermoleophilia bacterium]
MSMSEDTPRTEQILSYVQYVVEALVDEPDAVKVTESWENDELFVDVEVADDERGRIIGKGGRMIRSMRVVVRAAAGRDGNRASVELVETDSNDGSGSSEG